MFHATNFLFLTYFQFSTSRSSEELVIVYISDGHARVVVVCLFVCLFVLLVGAVIHSPGPAGTHA